MNFLQRTARAALESIIGGPVERGTPASPAADELRDMASGTVSLENPRTPLTRIFADEETHSGVVMNEYTALSLAPVWRCVALIAGAVARTPFLPYRRDDVGKEIARDHYLFTLLMKSFNPWLTAYRGKRQLQAWLLLWGNAYAEIEINGRGQVVGLWPWRPDRVRTTGLNGSLVYTYTMNNSTTVTLPGSHVLHLRGLETDGFNGLSPIGTMRQSLGLASAAQEYGNRFFSNNGRPGGWIEAQGALSKPARDNLRDTLESLHRGLKGAHRLAILEEGMKYHDVGLMPEEMQFLETRKFQAVDIARMYGVPPHKIAEVANMTLNNIEHQNIEWVNDCLDDWFANWESELSNALLSPREMDTIELCFYRQRLLRGDFKTRQEGFAIARQWGALSANEWRDEEGWNRRTDAGGDVFIQPLNFAAAGTTVTDSLDPDDPDADDNEPGDGTPAPVPGTPAPAPAAADGAK